MKKLFTRNNSFKTRGVMAGFFLVVCYVSFANMRFADAAITQKQGPSSGTLVGWWTLNEGSGSILGDYSGSANTASTTGSPTWIAGKRGGALTFNGSSQWAGGLSSTNLPSGTSPLSVFVWIKTTSTARETAFSYGSASTGQTVSINVNQLAANGHFVPDFFSTYTDSGVVVNDGRWHHIGFTLAGGSAAITMYVDGVAYSGTLSGTPNIASGKSVQIGRWVTQGPNDVNPYYFNGSVDDVRVYNRVLTGTEVKTIYQTGQVTRKVTDKTNLAGYWPLDEGSGTVAGDFSGNGNTGTLGGSPTWTLGKRGGALSFAAGNTQYVQIPNSSSVSPTTAATFAAWVYPTSMASHTAVFEKVNTDSDSSYMLYEGTSVEIAGQRSFRPHIYSPECGCYRYGAINYDAAPNNWYFVVYTYDSTTGTMKGYINGVNYPIVFSSIPVAGNTIRAGTAPLLLGKDTRGASWFQGKLDDVRIYNRVLSDTEIAALYKQNQSKVNAPQDTKMTNGLVGYWTFNGKDVGTTIADISGTGDNGYIFGGIATSSSLGIGKIGQGLKLDGTNNYVQAPNASALDLNGAMTMSVWIKTTSANDYAGIIQKSNSSTQGYQIGFSTGASGTLRCDLANGVGYTSVNPAINVLDGAWHHVVCSYDTATGLEKVYIDNVLTTGNIGSGYVVPSGLPVTIGYDRCCGPTRKFNGTIDEARIYNRALTDAEVKQLYLMGR